MCFPRPCIPQRFSRGTVGATEITRDLHLLTPKWEQLSFIFCLCFRLLCRMFSRENVCPAKVKRSLNCCKQTIYIARGPILKKLAKEDFSSVYTKIETKKKIGCYEKMICKFVKCSTKKRKKKWLFKDNTRPVDKKLYVKT